MMASLEGLLEEREWLLADGATGTNLFDMGLEAGEAPELWNVDRPERVRALYESAIGAGSDLFLTNSFGGTAARLRLHAAENRVRELNAAAARIAREAANAAVRPVVVAGSVGPTGELLAPVGTLTEAEATDLFSEQIEGLLEGGADVIWVETISSAEEFRAAAAAAARHG
ncbi:MAG: homocysteine S-methyltransferase family protein, partial [Pseudomonadota bacterium]